MYLSPVFSSGFCLVLLMWLCLVLLKNDLFLHSYVRFITPKLDRMLVSNIYIYIYIYASLA